MRRLAKVIVVGLILVVLASLLPPLILRARHQVERLECARNLVFLGTSLKMYHHAYGMFPQAAIPNEALPPEKRLSWMVGMSAYVTAYNPVAKLDRTKAWDAEENRNIVHH